MPYQLRKQTDFQIPSVRSVFSGTESIKFLGPKIWEQTLCTFRLCKTDIHRLSLI